MIELMIISWIGIPVVLMITVGIFKIKAITKGY